MNYSDNLRLFQADKDISEERYRQLLKAAWYEDKETAMKNLFFTGDLHHGRASSRLFRIGIKAMCESEPAYMNKLAQIVPEYSTWDVLLPLLHYPETKQEVIHLLLGRVNADINLIQERRPSSAFSLYMPKANEEDGRTLSSAFHLNADNYDALMQALREKADVSETHTDFHMDLSKMNEEEMLQTLVKYQRVAELMDMQDK